MEIVCNHLKLDLVEATECYNNYISEVVEFFEKNEENWGSSDPNPKYDLLRDAHFSVFKLHYRQIVVTWAYIYRKRFNNFFPLLIFQICKLKALVYEKWDEALEDLVLVCFQNEKENRRLKFLCWIAYLFEMSIHFRYHNFSYEKIWKAFKSERAISFGLRNYFANEKLSDIEVYRDICKLCSPLEEAYFETPVCCDIFSLFPQAVGIVEKAYKYDRIWKGICGKKTLVSPSKEIMRVFLSKYSEREVFLGYISRHKIIPQQESKALPCLMDGSSYIVEDNLKSVRASLDTRERKATQEKVGATFDDAKSFFVVTRKFLLKRQEVKRNACRSEYKRDIKAYDTISGNFMLANGHMDVLNESIQNNNIHEFGNELFAVYSSNSNSGDQIFLLDTSSSSEEDESQLKPCQVKFMENIVPKLKRWKYSTTSKDEALENLYRTREFYETRKLYQTRYMRQSLRAPNTPGNVKLDNNMRCEEKVIVKSNSTAKASTERMELKRQKHIRPRKAVKNSENDTPKKSSEELDAEKIKTGSRVGNVPHAISMDNTGTKETNFINLNKKINAPTQKFQSVKRTEGISKQELAIEQKIFSCIQKDLPLLLNGMQVVDKSVKSEIAAMNTRMEDMFSTITGFDPKIKKNVGSNSIAEHDEKNKLVGKATQQNEIPMKCAVDISKVKKKKETEETCRSEQDIEKSAKVSCNLPEIPMENTGAKPKERSFYPESIPSKQSPKKNAMKVRKSPPKTMAIPEREYNINRAVDDFKNLHLDPTAEARESKELFEQKVRRAFDEFFADKLKK